MTWIQLVNATTAQLIACGKNNIIGGFKPKVNLD